MGYKYQFITLAGIHSMWFNMFDLAHAYAQGRGRPETLRREGAAGGVRRGGSRLHLRVAPAEVGTGCFDKVTTIIQGGASSVTALTGSTEEQQF